MTATWPTPAEVEAADMRQLLAWVRYLPSPGDVDRPVLDRIVVRLREKRVADPAGYTAASKSLMRGPGE